MTTSRIFVVLLLLSSPAWSQVPASWQSRGVGGGGALYSPSINPADDREYYLACDMSELFHTTDFGDSYAVVNFTQLQGGRFASVQFTADPNVRYCLNYGGDYVTPARSADGGKSWANLPGNPQPYDSCFSLWADYDNPNRVLLAGWAALYLSTNAGATFFHLNVALTNGTGGEVGGVFFDGSNITVGTSEGVLVSADGGGTFTNTGLPGIPPGQYLRSFAGAKAGGHTRFFCLTVGSTYAGQDGGEYWANLRGIYSSDDGASSWTPRMTGIDLSSDFLMFVAMARNELDTVYAGGAKYASSGTAPGIMLTTNGGLNWTNVFLSSHNQNIQTGWSGQGGDRGWGYGEAVYGLAVAPTNPAKAVFTDMGFAHRTSDGGATWQQAYVSPADAHPANATAIARASYHSVGLEDTSCWQIFWSDPTNVFAAFTDIGGVRSVDGGTTWSFNYTGASANTIYRLARDPVTHTLYAAASDIHDLYQSTRLADYPLDNGDPNGKILFSLDNGASWQTLHQFNHPVFWLCQDPNQPNLMYASVVHSTSGGVYVCTNLPAGAASTWSRLPSPPRTQGHPASLVVLHDGKVLCTFSGRRTPDFTPSSGLFLYDPAARSWSDLSAPGMFYWTKDVVLDPWDAAQRTWYACVFSGWGGPPNGLGGLYRTTDRGAHWSRINALDRVTSITFHPANSNEVYLTTETSGLWHSTNIRASLPTFSLVSSYPFRQPERVFFNPWDLNEVWVTSFGNGLAVGRSAPPAQTLQFAASSFSASETAGSLTVTVTRSGGATGSVSVNFATADGTALSPNNYQATNGVLVWPDGDAGPRTFTVPVIHTPGYTGNLTFGLSLASPSGAALGVNFAAGVILDADPPPPPTNFCLTVVNGTGTGLYGVGTTVAVSAFPAPSGYGFDRWTGAVVANPLATNTTLTMPSNDVTLVANYQWVRPGTNYEVGPGQPYPTLAAVPWLALQPRDVVNIHCQPGGYHEVVMLSNSGASNAPITLHGVPDPVTGALPVIDGSNSVSASNIPWRSTVFDGLGLIVVSRAQGTTYGYIPSWITIENLHLQNADRATPHTTSAGVAGLFSRFACGIYVEYAQHLTVRGCEINGAENGFFCNSKNGAPQELSSDILLERNHIHDNGYPNDYGVHNLYTEALSITLQYNLIGPLRPGACGEQWKNRSAGTRIRYNQWIMGPGPGTAMWLESPQGGQGIIDLDPSYKTVWCYGNVIYDPPNSTSPDMIRFDAMGIEGVPRSGTLYFYHNTVVNHANQSQRWSTAIFDLPRHSEVLSTGIHDVLDCRNNILASFPTTPAGPASTCYLLVSDDGTIDFGTNWISPAMQLVELPYGVTNFHGTLTGTNQLVRGDALGQNNPGFVDLAATNFHLVDTSRAIDAAGPQAAAIAGSPDDITLEYVYPTNFQARVSTGAGLDLGAFEGNSTNLPPPPGPGALQFAAASVAVSELAGIVSLTVNRVGGTNGAASVDFATADGTAGAPLNYVSTHGTLTWPGGDASSRSIAIPIVYFPGYLGNRLFGVTLSNPTVASLGSPAAVTVTILETDPSPPNYPPIADPQALDVLENTPVSITLTGHDGDHQALTFSIAVAPLHGTLSGAPPQLSYTPAAGFIGPDYFFFIASDGITNSAPAIVQLGVNYPTNQPPAVTLLSPTNHAWFVGPTNLSLTAAASAAPGISRVNYYSGTNFLGSVSNAPYLYLWTNVGPGTYTLFAKAFDNHNGRCYSAPTVVTVLGGSPWLRFFPAGAGQGRLGWPLGVDGWLLQEATSPAGPWSLSWYPVTDTPTNHSAVVPLTGQRFFRLALPQ